MEDTGEVDCFNCPAFNLCVSNLYKFVLNKKTHNEIILAQNECYSMRILSELLNKKEKEGI